jgi:DNA-binding NarL/FixJ family response regulator
MTACKLSVRECQVIVLVSDGKCSKEIARLLSITDNTTKNHFRNIRMKLEAINMAHAAVIAMRRGFIAS